MKCSSEDGRRPRAESESVVRGKATAMRPRSSRTAAAGEGVARSGEADPGSLRQQQKLGRGISAPPSGAAWSGARAGARGARDVDSGTAAACSNAATGKTRRRREGRTPRSRRAQPRTWCNGDGNTAGGISAPPP